MKYKKIREIDVSNFRSWPKKKKETCTRHDGLMGTLKNARK